MTLFRAQIRGAGPTQSGGLVLMLSGVLAACAASPEAGHTPPPDDPSIEPTGTAVVPQRTKAMRRFPCTECHDSVESAELSLPPRAPHTAMPMKHMSNLVNCYQCHDRNDMDMLRLLTGEAVSFDESARVCGQCHPERKHDWDMGAHGKQVGSWRGLRHRYACTDCHDPHAPARAQLMALPPPPFPKFGVRKQAQE